MDFKYILAKAMKRILNPPALNKCSIDKTSRVCSRSELTRVSMGKYSYVGNFCFLVNAKIGSFCSIADRCCIGGAAHPTSRVSTSPVFHDGSNIMRKNFAAFPSLKTPETVIANDVWIGMGCYIKAGVTIGNGAVIGMGSVVTHDVPPYEIWAGNPAHFIRKRFDEEKIEALMKMQWWDFPEEQLKRFAPFFDDPASLIEHYSESE